MQAIPMELIYFPYVLSDSAYLINFNIPLF
jgi:hypothetical protein